MKQNIRQLSACVLASVVGTSVGLAFAGEPDSGPKQMAPEATAPAMANAPGTANLDYASRRFASADKLRGSKVENAKKDNVGSVEELIVDRGSGSVAFVVLNAGGFLGIGTKQVAVPYSSFGWDPKNQHLTLETTAAMVKSWPEFKKENWAGTNEALSARLSQDYYKTLPNNYPSGMSTDDARISGTVTKVDRRAVPGTNTEEMVLTVKGKDNKSQEVVLAPSWYMSGNSVAVYRDAPVDLRVVRMDRDGRQILMARSLAVDSKDVPLYDDAGSPRWWSKKESMVLGQPFLLDTDIDGKHVMARGEKCGKINDLILECNTGRVAFLSIDPDQNLLGIGDKKRLIPWGVATVVTTDAVQLDSSKEMIVSAPETPSDLAMISGDSKYQNVYQGYGISEPYYYNRNWNSPARTDRDLEVTTPKREPAPK